MWLLGRLDDSLNSVPLEDPDVAEPFAVRQVDPYTSKEVEALPDEELGEFLFLFVCVFFKKMTNPFSLSLSGFFSGNGELCPGGG